MRRFLTILLVVYLSNTTYSQTISLKEQVITIPKNQISNLPTKIKVTGGTDNVYAYIKDIYVKVRLYQFTIDNYTLNSGRNMLLADNGNLEVFISLHPYAEHNGQQKSFSDINQENKEYIYLDLSHNIQVSIYGNKFTPKLDAFLIPVSNPTSTVKTGATLMGVYSSLYKSSTLAEANSKYKAGVNCTARVLRATLSTNSFAPNNWNSPQEKETYSLKIETKTDDDFWNSPTKAIAESKKTNSKTSKDDFWNNPTKTTAENKTTSTKTSDDDFWNNPTKTISENKQKNDDDFWNNPTKTIKEPKGYTSQLQPNTFIDPRDQQVYKYMKVGNQIWMAENLNYDCGFGAYCYGHGTNYENCEEYGRIYSYEVSNKVCPSDWHVPSENEWNELYQMFYDEYKGVYGVDYVSPDERVILGFKKLGFNPKQLYAGRLYECRSFSKGETEWWSSRGGYVRAEFWTGVDNDNVDGSTEFYNAYSSKSGYYVICVKD